MLSTPISEGETLTRHVLLISAEKIRQHCRQFRVVREANCGFFAVMPVTRLSCCCDSQSGIKLEQEGERLLSVYRSTGCRDLFLVITDIYFIFFVWFWLNS